MHFSVFQRAPSRSNLILTAALALPFALIGTAVAYRAVWTVFSALSMQGWPSVPATLEHVELVADGQNSERATASYTYAVNGRQFTGKRVSLYGADNLGSFHKTAAAELQGFLARQTPYPVHVNPKDPSESILMPVVRWEVVAFSLIFVVVFGCIGWGLLISALVGLNQIRVEKALAARYPNEPWRWRVAWSANRIKSTENSTALGAVSFTVFWNVFTWPMLFALPGKLRDKEYMGLLFLIFPLMGVGLMYWAGVAVARARRFGRTYLVLDTFPARPGERLLGRIYAPPALEGADDAVPLRLTCEKSSRNSSPRRGQTYGTAEVWRYDAKSAVLRGQSASGETMLKVDFPLPANSPDSSNSWINDSFAWQITANAVLAGADFEAAFEVPVFKRTAQV